MARPGRIGFKFAPQARHVDTQIMHMLDMVRPPHPRQQLTLGEDLPARLQQQAEKLELGWREMHVRAGTAYATAFEIDLDITKLHFCTLSDALAATQQIAQPSAPIALHSRPAASATPAFPVAEAAP